ncbi:MAG TPA: transketolase [Streptosporangiaceae bacterium]|nr:transketolase [Streptosporangiaceae bacterium]
MTATSAELARLRGHSLRIRQHVVDMCALPDGGHLGGSLSVTDILTVLYFAVLRVDPLHPDDPDRDRFVLSKGHAALALYAALAERGYFPVTELAGFGREGGKFLTHPVRAVPGVEAPTGSLGHGLSLGAGFALSARLAGRESRAFVVTGDGELQEGSVWEAAASAAALRLDNLVVIVDRNGFQQSGATEEICPVKSLAARWESFGWAVTELDGHDLGALALALNGAPWKRGQPSAIIARTVKARGVPFAEGRWQSHYMRLSERAHARARTALARTGDRDD